MDRKFKVCIVSCYMGRLPEYFKAFLISCKYNKNFNWMIITNDSPEFELPENVKIVSMQLSDVETLIKKKIGSWAILPSAYKLCDYKVAYGLIFEDYLSDYSHWGYGDLDVIYGDLSKFITDEKLEIYDKVFPLGHLSIMKNNETCKKAFMFECKDTISYRKVYGDARSFYFDENKGINEKMMAAGMNVYREIDFIDISSIYSRMRNVTAEEVSMLLPCCSLAELSYPKNSSKQAYIWDNGKLFQYIYDNEISKSEYAYMHFRRNLSINIDNNCCRFIIGKSIIDKLNVSVDKKIILRYNNGAIKDTKDLIWFLVKRYAPRVTYGIKSSICIALYNIKPVRVLVQRIRKLIWRNNNE